MQMNRLLILLLGTTLAACKTPTDVPVHIEEQDEVIRTPLSEPLPSAEESTEGLPEYVKSWLADSCGCDHIRTGELAERIYQDCKLKNKPIDSIFKYMGRGNWAFLDYDYLNPKMIEKRDSANTKANSTCIGFHFDQYGLNNYYDQSYGYSTDTVYTEPDVVLIEPVEKYLWKWRLYKHGYISDMTFEDFEKIIKGYHLMGQPIERVIHFFDFDNKITGWIGYYVISDCDSNGVINADNSNSGYILTIFNGESINPLISLEDLRRWGEETG